MYTCICVNVYMCVYVCTTMRAVPMQQCGQCPCSLHCFGGPCHIEKVRAVPQLLVSAAPRSDLHDESGHCPSTGTFLLQPKPHECDLKVVPHPCFMHVGALCANINALLMDQLCLREHNLSRSIRYPICFRLCPPNTFLHCGMPKQTFSFFVIGLCSRIPCET